LCALAQQPPQGVSEYAKRPAQAPQGHAQLDPHGRRPAPSRPVEEDHLEIPAFLRRQSNH
jgi:cell division protein FtsZ